MSALILVLAAALAGGLAVAAAQVSSAPTPDVTVGSQYTTTHVYVAPADFDRFVASFVATFGGKASKRDVTTVTPTPSRTRFEPVRSPVGNLSVFGYESPVPYPFGSERAGYLVTDIVAPFPDPIGRDVIIEWPGGVKMQLYWHTKPPGHEPPLARVPENRVYTSRDRADTFIRDFVAFAHGAVTSDEAAAPGVEIGRPGEMYRLVRMDSAFGKVAVLVTDGHLPWPYGLELAGYEVSNLRDTLAKATAAGVKILVSPHTADGRISAMVEFPGGYIAEIHAAARPS
jgi:hypothetical protein